MHKTGAAPAPSARGGTPGRPEWKYSQPARKPLISKDVPALLFLRAVQRKHGGTRACAPNTEDINKVIHRNSGFLAKPEANQALAAYIAEKPQQGMGRLAQFWGFPGP
jgi:hypothetical protein